MTRVRHGGPRLRSTKGTLFPYPDVEVLWAVEVDSEDQPLLNKTLGDNAPRIVRASKVFREIHNNQSSYRCFFTGVACFIGPKPTFWSRSKYPWNASKEHLLSRYHHAQTYARDWTRTNFVFSGTRINYEFGNIPASVKLLFRRYLKSKPYNRDDTRNQNATFDIVFQHLIELEKSFSMHGKYPWHPSSYSLASQRRASMEFTTHINQLEREFFEQLTMQNRFEHFDSALLPIQLYY